jgi:hypothetical protein
MFVGYLTTLDYAALNEGKMGKDLGGNGHSLIEVFS